MAKWQFHRLTPGDIALFRAMNALFADVFEDTETYLGRTPSDSYVRGLLGKDNVIALVAVQDEAVVGALVAYVLSKFESERSEVYIYDLAVSADHRRRGIATGLIEHLQEMAADRGAWVVYVQADYGDDPAVALYSKLGAREDVLHFDIPVRVRPSR